MVNKLLILYKTQNLCNGIFKNTKSYCNSFKNVESYFLICDENINVDVIVEDKVIRVKMKENNWDSLLVKVLKSFYLFKNSDYTHIMVSNISTLINIPLVYSLLSKEHKCISVKGEYSFNNIRYSFPSGAAYILSIDLVKDICEFFTINKYLQKCKLDDFFMNNYPTTDDIFFGYYLYNNKIKIKEMERLDILNTSFTIDESILKFHHIRVKTGNSDYDKLYFYLTINQMYNENKLRFFSDM